MKTKFRQLHFRGLARFTNSVNLIPFDSDHGRQPQFGQNAILASSKAKLRKWKIMNCFLYIYICTKPFSLTKNERKLFLVPESSGPLLERLPLKVSKLDYKLVPRFWNFCTDFCRRGTRFLWKREFNFFLFIKRTITVEPLHLGHLGKRGK